MAAATACVPLAFLIAASPDDRAPLRAGPLAVERELFFDEAAASGFEGERFERGFFAATVLQCGEGSSLASRERTSHRPGGERLLARSKRRTSDYASARGPRWRSIA